MAISKKTINTHFHYSAIPFTAENLMAASDILRDQTGHDEITTVPPGSLLNLLPKDDRAEAVEAGPWMLNVWGVINQEGAIFFHTS